MNMITQVRGVSLHYGTSNLKGLTCRRQALEVEKPSTQATTAVFLTETGTDVRAYLRASVALIKNRCTEMRIPHEAAIPRQLIHGFPNLPYPLPLGPIRTRADDG